MKAIMIVCGMASFALMITYLVAMGRISAFMRSRGRTDVSITDPNGQMRLIRAVFWEDRANPVLGKEHRMLLRIARTTGVAGLILILAILGAIWAGYLH